VSRASKGIHERLVLDRELPGRGRDVLRFRPDRQAHEELPARDHRAVPLSDRRSPLASTCSSGRSPT
jgi:hypothetical protein